LRKGTYFMIVAVAILLRRVAKAKEIFMVELMVRQRQRVEQLFHLGLPVRVDDSAVEWLVKLFGGLARGLDPEKLEHMPRLFDLLHHYEIVVVLQVGPAYTHFDIVFSCVMEVRGGGSGGEVGGGSGAAGRAWRG